MLMPAQAVFVRANHNANSDENRCGCVPRFAGGWSGFAATWAQAAELINAVVQNKSIVAWMRLETWVGGLIGGGLSGSKAGKTADLLFNVVGYDQSGKKTTLSFRFINPKPANKLKTELPMLTGLANTGSELLQHQRGNALMLILVSGALRTQSPSGPSRPAP